ncbi:RNA polymerase sigma factor [Cryptosporangium japonicum]|uniref:RNA polymerase sigma factor n=1 Tax=Cryptosporangium japonicum TaxID=80872 RepID=A0ABN0UPN4_9ACTN
MTISDQRTDRQLWADAAQRDGDAFAALFRRHARAVYNHCFRLTGSWSVAEDAVSVTFLTAWRRRDEVRLARESALPWLLAVATNVSQHQQRSARRRLALVGRLSADPPTIDHADDVAARLDDERRMREVLEVVRGLPNAEREALALCLWSGVSYADAAEALGLAESSVRARVSRARARLAAHFPQPDLSLGGDR